MFNKAELRKKYKELRANMTEEALDEMSLQIANQALKLAIWDKTNYHIFLSSPEKSEVNTEYILHILQGKDKSIMVPKADFTSGIMKHILLQENTTLKISKYGIPEPVSGIEVQPEIIDIVFVPLLAYDQEGSRVGYGKGFYDRFLANCRKNTLFIGLSFFEPEAKIESNTNDIPLDYCITPKGIRSFN